ncbi:MAG: glycerol-3-phosphate dehydrogenase/oxidase, partial [Bdellovibrionales bacterium]|nr:glycerol-3-phosphate dehydrogenase/oxidase [Bdellovibrionales bacterium]
MGQTFSFQTREENLKRLQTEEFDLAIIGGGITGAGIARDAVSRGMKVALLEAKDFAVGTSSRSSKLIHGGIRYLENMEFGLVHEALTERRNLFDMAPHLVHPLRFLLPLYKEGRVGMFKMGLGMLLYDLLAAFESPELHERLDPEDSILRAPLLRSEGLLGSYEYSDAYMDDDRLTIETMRSAHEAGAVISNYVKVDGAEFAGQKMSALRCRDQLGQKTFGVKARHFVSSVGPWTDIFGHEVMKTWRDCLRPTKGIHVTLERSRLPLKQAVVLAADAEKRIIFMIPRHEMIIVGTTDTNFSGDPTDVKTQKEDVDYLLRVVQGYFPGANLTYQDLIGSYSGVRPLIKDESSSESGTSREHKIWTDPRNVTFVAGGKYTTYRLMAEHTVTQCLEQFPIDDRVKFGRPDTRGPLNTKASVQGMQNARREISRWVQEYQVSPALVSALVERHGMEAQDMLESGRALIGIAKPSHLLW